MSGLARRYARAVFEAAQEAGATDAVGQDLRTLAAALADDELMQALADPQLSRERLGAALGKVTQSAHPLVQNLVRVAVERRRETLLPDLPEAFDGFAREARGEVHGVVETAKPMSDGEVGDLATKVSASLGQKVSLSARVVPELIGGVRVRVGNTLYDGSVAGALEDLERRLMEAPL